MNIVANFEHGASSSRGKHEGESSFVLCDRLSRTRDNSPRQLPTDHDYAVPTREYQTDQSSLNLPRLLPALSSRKRQLQKHPHRLASLSLQQWCPGAAIGKRIRVSVPHPLPVRSPSVSRRLETSFRLVMRVL